MDECVISQEYAEYLRYKEAVKYNCVGAITTDAASTVQYIKLSIGPKTTLRIQSADTDVRLMIDTVNVLDEETYHAMMMKPKLEVCCTRFYGYTSSSPLNLLGQFDADVQLGQRMVKCYFVVIKGRHDCLLSYGNAVELELINFGPSVNAIDTSKTGKPHECLNDELKAKFPHLFSGKGGVSEGRQNQT